jgi:cytoskeleton protein RodZ
VSDAGADAELSAASGRPGAAGAALFKERRRQGLSLGDISRQLKLSVRQVEALERDDYSGYKSPVFIHGFIRNYAKLLGLDPEPLIRATDLMLAPPVIPGGAPREQERPQPTRLEDRKYKLWPAIVAVLLVGIAVAVYFGSRRAPDTRRSAPTAAARDKSAPSSKVPAQAKAGAEAKARTESKPEVQSAAKPAARSDAKPEAKPQAKTESVEHRSRTESPATGVAEPAGRVTVRMIFEQDSWVEIKDRAGNVIFGQLNPAGSRRSISGEPPLSVVVGNAAGVRLFQGDKSIDLAPHTRVDVARLKLE